MCGRFCCAHSPKEIVDRLYQDKYCTEDIVVDCQDYTPSYNISPSSNIPVLYEKESQRRLQTMEWGYIPSWAKELPTQKPINARRDTLEKQNNYFSSSKDSRRCIVIAEGFFEWKKQTNGKKQAFYIKRKDGKLMAFAGLYDKSELTAKTYSCVIITTEASQSFSCIHDRMPVLLNENDAMTWINSSEKWKDKIQDLMKPVEDILEFYQVSDAVGSAKSNSSRLIVPIDSQKGSIKNFFKPKRA